MARRRLEGLERVLGVNALYLDRLRATSARATACQARRRAAGSGIHVPSSPSPSAIAARSTSTRRCRRRRRRPESVIEAGAAAGRPGVVTGPLGEGPRRARPGRRIIEEAGRHARGRGVVLATAAPAWPVRRCVAGARSRPCSRSATAPGRDRVAPASRAALSAAVPGLESPSPHMARRRLEGLERVLGVNALFSTAYGNVGSSIYYALGLVASYALGLTPVVFIITGFFFFCTAATLRRGDGDVPRGGRLLVLRPARLQRVLVVLRGLGGDAHLHGHDRHLGVLRPALHRRRLRVRRGAEDEPRRHHRRRSS